MGWGTSYHQGSNPARSVVISAIHQLDRLLPSVALGPGFLPGRRDPNVASVLVIPARMPESRARDRYLLSFDANRHSARSVSGAQIHGKGKYGDRYRISFGVSRFR
jgi:hypothetical protein